MTETSATLLDQLDRSSAAVEVLIRGIRPDQWSSPSPCTEWTVRRLVTHLVGMNLVFAAMLTEETPPTRGDDLSDDELAQAYHSSAATLRAAFGQPGALARSYASPMGTATGANRLQIRLYDLLAHGWDLARATGQPASLPEDAAEHALAFVRHQLRDDTRPGRFAPAEQIADEAPAIDRLAAFLGRPVTQTTPPSTNGTYVTLSAQRARGLC